MLDVRGITVRFGETTALDDGDLTVADHSIIALIGPSGSGKSTLLRVIAGLEHPDAGDIRWDGASILKVPPHRRDFGMMFQDYALFPHRTVAQNVAFGLRMRRVPNKEVTDRTQAILDLVGLADYGPRSVGTLSGGGNAGGVGVPAHDGEGSGADRIGESAFRKGPGVARSVRTGIGGRPDRDCAKRHHAERAWVAKRNRHSGSISRRWLSGDGRDGRRVRPHSFIG